MRRSVFSIASLLALGSTAALLSAPAQAQEVGRVISSTAMISQVSVPRQVCAQEVVQVQTQEPTSKTGAGALIGGIAGGAIGNAFGNGQGRAAATILGIFGGLIVGDKIEAGNTPQTNTTQQTVNRCSTQNFVENRTTGYQVVYEYAGKQYSVQLPQDPGPTIQLQVSPAQQVLPPAAAPVYQAPKPVAQADSNVFVAQAPGQYIPVDAYTPYIGTTVISSSSSYQPAVVYAAPVVIASPYYRPAVGASFVIRSGHGGYGHRGYYPGYFR
jgi:uncharacterized protein YcfJ